MATYRRQKLVARLAITGGLAHVVLQMGIALWMKMPQTSRMLTRPPQLISAIFLDCDGTLVETETAYMNAFNKALSQIACGVRNNVCVSPSEWGRDFAGQGNGSAVAVARYDLKCSAADFDALWMQHFEQATAQPGSIPLLKGFDALYQRARARMMQIAVASSSDGQVLRRKLRNGVVANSAAVSSLSDFDLILSNDNVSRRKPDPEIYTLAASMLSLQPQNCMVVEDSATGVLAGARAGMYVVAVPNRYTGNHDFTPASVVTDSLDNIVELLKLESD